MLSGAPAVWLQAAHSSKTGSHWGTLQIEVYSSFILLSSILLLLQAANQQEMLSVPATSISVGLHVKGLPPAEMRLLTVFSLQWPMFWRPLRLSPMLPFSDTVVILIKFVTFFLVQLQQVKVCIFRLTLTPNWLSSVLARRVGLPVQRPLYYPFLSVPHGQNL